MPARAAADRAPAVRAAAVRATAVGAAGAVAALALTVMGAVPVHAVDIERLHDHVAYLAADEMGGRAVGSEGETRTLDWIERELAAAGVEPGTPDGWLQSVALIERRPLASTAEFRRGRRALAVAADDLLLAARDSESRVVAPLYFAGRMASEDSRLRAAVAGKVVLFETEPAPDPARLAQAVRATARRLTEAGAAAAIAVVEPGAAFAALRAQREAPALAMAADDAHAPIEGVMSEAAAVALITGSGGDWDKLRARAARPGYAGEPLGITAELTARSAVRRFDSDNLVGRIAGRKPRSGAVLVLAHWDGLGLCRPEGTEDRICNGAADNASGIAALIEIARELVRLRHDRDIILLATTGEEHGLLGARAFAANPPRPLGEIVAAFNLDMLGLAPPATPVAVIGTGRGRFEEAVRGFVRARRQPLAAPDVASAFLRRQDGAVLLDRNVPVLMVNRSFGDAALLADFLRSRYHGPADETAFLPSWEGLAADTELHVALVRHFADARRWRWGQGR